MSDAAVTLEVFQSLWAMEDLPFNSPQQWSLAERVGHIAEAGFAGLAVDLGAKQKPAAAELVQARITSTQSTRSMGSIGAAKSVPNT